MHDRLFPREADEVPLDFQHSSLLVHDDVPRDPVHFRAAQVRGQDVRKVVVGEKDFGVAVGVDGDPVVLGELHQLWGHDTARLEVYL